VESLLVVYAEHVRARFAAGFLLAGCGFIVDPLDALTRGDGGGGGDASDAPMTCNADITKDDKNCGSCGHNCRGTSCTQGACDPLLVLQGFFADSLDVSNGTLYAAQNMTGIFRIDPGMATKLQSDSSATMIAVHDPWIFYGDGQGLWRIPIGGGAPMPVSNAVPRDLVHNDSWVYWLSGPDLWRTPADGSGAPEKWAAGEMDARLSADSAWVAGTVDVANGVIQHDVSTGAIVQSKSNFSGTINGPVAVSSLGVYFEGYGPSDHLFRADRGGPNVVDLGATTAISLIIADSKLVVIGYNNNSDPLRGCSDSTCAGGPKPIMNGQANYPTALAIDATWVYLGDSNPSIRKIAR